ncbi:MAG: serine/threonine protein kinase [Bacteroidales bacterium]|nr:serine/threonine protein kinase [Bacteroidales bacterium]
MLDNPKSSLYIGYMLDVRYKLLRPLSSAGGTADVWLALDTLTIDEVYDEDRDEMAELEGTGIEVAIKVYRPKNALDLGEQRFRDEFKIVFNCHHSNLVQPINFGIAEGTMPYLVLPFCRCGSSEKKQGRLTTSKELWRYIGDVASGLAYLHAFSPTIVHHDIKPANVLVDDNSNYAITDFGISSHRGLNREGYDNSASGTMAYMAPERFRDDYESMPESDIWSLGATLYELITGHVPFGEDGGMAQLKGQHPVQPIKKPIPKDVKKLVYDCLDLDPKKRPSAQTIARAAAQRHYPPRSLWTAIVGIALIVIAAVIITLAVIPKGHEPGPPPPSPEEAYAHALRLMNSAIPDSLQLGVAQLDTLSALGYVPALYELAHTYGWYTDSLSLARKALLGIDVYPPESESAYLPVSNKINTRAVWCLTRIQEIGDSAYAAYNADALYRLASYSIATDKVFVYNLDTARRQLERAREWAILAADATLLRRIDSTLSQIQKISK